MDRRYRCGWADVAGFNPVREFQGVNLPLGNFAFVDVRGRFAEPEGEYALGLAGRLAPCPQLGRKAPITKSVNSA